MCEEIIHGTRIWVTLGKYLGADAEGRWCEADLVASVITHMPFWKVKVKIMGG